MNTLSLAIKYCTKNFLHEDIINELYNDDELIKQLCLIELNSVKNQKEADILVFNLTGKGTPIRETASFKILELIEKDEFRDFFQTKEIYDTFVNAVTDINPSVSRNTIEIIKYVKNPQYIYKCIIQKINETLIETENLKQNHSYIKNKKNFSLYWNLECIASLGNKINAGKELINILKRTSMSNDYTIREKTAKCASIFCFSDILNVLKNDENIYVKLNIGQLL